MLSMLPQNERRVFIGIVVLFLVLQIVPLVAAYASVGTNSVFGGFLLNPYDGNSYLAKMRQGFDGAWQFTLPYSVEPGVPTAINLYYLFLGHVARWTGVSLIVIFHVARLTGALLLCLSLYRFLGSFFSDAGPRLLAFGLALFGSGLGWLAASFGGVTPDFWWAEAYPFLTAYVNPHFVLGLALQLWLLTPSGERNRDRIQAAKWVGAAAVLSIVYPFGWAATVAILTGWTLALALQRAPFKRELLHAATVSAGGVPYAVYTYYTVQTHPVLSLWDAQNLTPTPAAWDVLATFSPVLLLALIGFFFVALRKERRLQFLMVWVAVIAIAIYAPANLQRRLATGLYIPLVCLAVYATYQLIESTVVRRLTLFAMLLLSLPTNAIVVAGGIASVRNSDPLLTLSVAEADGFRWLNANAPHGSLVLAAPQTGLFLPSNAPVRVLFGHWFETVHARDRHDELVAFFDVMDSSDVLDYLESEDVDYIFYGPRERVLGAMPQLTGWTPVYETADLQIWSEP